MKKIYFYGFCIYLCLRLFTVSVLNAQTGVLTGVTGNFDGSTIYYVAENNGICTIFKSAKDNSGKWDKGISEESLNKYLEGYKIKTPFLTYDGRFLYFSAHGSDTRGFDIFCSKRENDQWNKPEIVSVLSSEYDDISPSLPADNLNIFFARYNPENECMSIYSSHLDNSNWSLPQLLPAPINTGCETFVCVSPAGESILFSSDRLIEKKKKKYNLFCSQQIGTMWLPPVATDEPPKEYGEINAFIDGSKIMTVTNENDNIAVQEAAQRLASKPYTIIAGTILNEHGKPVDADITVKNAATSLIHAKSVNDKLTGKFFLVLPNDGIYAVNYQKKFGSEKFEIINTSDNIPGQIINRDIVIADKVMINLNIRDGISNRLIDAKIQVFDKNKTTKLTQSQQGIYQAEIPVFENVEIEITKKNYIREILNINLYNNPEFNEMFYDIKLKPDLRLGKVKITDLASNKGKNANVSVKNLDIVDEKIFILNPDSGRYEFNIRKDNKYSISVTLPGCLYYFTVWNADAGRISHSLEVKPVPLSETGKVSMNHLIFNPEESILLSEAFGELDCVVNVLKNNPEYNATITLYYSEKEKELTQRRIRNITSFMEFNSVAKNRCKIEAVIGNEKNPGILFVKNH